MAGGQSAALPDTTAAASALPRLLTGQRDRGTQAPSALPALLMVGMDATPHKALGLKAQLTDGRRRLLVVGQCHHGSGSVDWRGLRLVGEPPNGGRGSWTLALHPRASSKFNVYQQAGQHGREGCRGEAWRLAFTARGLHHHRPARAPPRPSPAGEAW